MSFFSCNPTYTLTSLINQEKESKDKAIKINVCKKEIDETIDQFKKGFSLYTKESVLTAVEKIYSKDAFLNDRIHSVEGKDAIIQYFSNSFDKIESASFFIQDVVYGESQIIVQWIMTIKLPKAKKEHSFLGMSSLRFNYLGLIIYHQDFFDYSEILSQVRGVKNLINYAKSKS